MRLRTGKEGFDMTQDVVNCWACNGTGKVGYYEMPEPNARSEKAACGICGGAGVVDSLIGDDE